MFSIVNFQTHVVKGKDGVAWLRQFFSIYILTTISWVAALLLLYCSQIHMVNSVQSVQYLLGGRDKNRIELRIKLVRSSFILLQIKMLLRLLHLFLQGEINKVRMKVWQSN